MALLVTGTVAQRYIGLYPSQELFFGSFILWAGPVPLPGAYSVIGFITLGLLAKLILKTRFERRYAGIILTHASVVVLLAGGLVTALFRQDGYMALAEGESAASYDDYRARELVVTRDGRELAVFGESALEAGHEVKLGTDALRVLSYCHHCSLAKMDKGWQVTPIPGSDEDSRATLLLQPPGGPTLAVSQRLDDAAEWKAGGHYYRFALRPVSYPLPFTVTLSHFAKDDYPGTDMARAYRSDVTLHAGALKWDSAIEMNQPLRHDGYTLYQSSYLDENGRRLSVLAVVKNAGRWFPYLSVASLCAGITLHLGLLLAHRKLAS